MVSTDGVGAVITGVMGVVVIASIDAVGSAVDGMVGPTTVSPWQLMVTRSREHKSPIILRDAAVERLSILTNSLIQSINGHHIKRVNGTGIFIADCTS